MHISVKPKIDAMATPRTKFMEKINRNKKKATNKTSSVLTSMASSTKEVDNQSQNIEDVKLKLSLAKRSKLDAISFLQDENGIFVFILKA